MNFIVYVCCLLVIVYYELVWVISFLWDFLFFFGLLLVWVVLSWWSSLGVVKLLFLWIGVWEFWCGYCCVGFLLCVIFFLCDLCLGSLWWKCCCFVLWWWLWCCILFWWFWRWWNEIDLFVWWGFWWEVVCLGCEVLVCCWLCWVFFFNCIYCSIFWLLSWLKGYDEIVIVRVWGRIRLFLEVV